MRSLTSKLLVLIVSAFVASPFAVGACATSETSSDDTTDDTGASTKKKDAGKTTAKKDTGTSDDDDDDDDTVNDSGPTIKDASPTTDSGKDASAVVKDSGTWPAEGSSCTTAGEVASKPCGMCGNSKTFCGGTPGALTWQTYGFCDQPPDAECVAGTKDTGSCGNCGTQSRVCQTDCHYQLGACSEPPGACQPDLRRFNAGLSCTDATLGRYQVCDSTCKWGLPSDPCTARSTSLTLSSTVGGLVNDEFAYTPLSLQIGKLSPGSTCTSASISTSISTSYAYIQLINPSAKAATVTLWTAQAFASSASTTNLAVYARTTVPVTDPERKTCAVGNTYCTTAPCETGAAWSGFVGANALKVPAGATMMLHVFPDGSAETGAFQVFARTDALN